MQRPEAYRLFLALTVPDAVKDALGRVQTELRRALPESAVSWTRREQFHLTLKFLGNVPADRVGMLTDALRSVGRGFSPLNLRAAGVGFFPDAKFPRVIWAGVRDEKESLLKLQQAVDAAAREFTAEKSGEKFSGHVTLGRVRNLSRPLAERLQERALASGEKCFGEWIAGGVEIIRSDRSSGGSRYTTLATAPLATTG